MKSLSIKLQKVGSLPAIDSSTAAGLVLEEGTLTLTKPEALEEWAMLKDQDPMERHQLLK